MIRIIPFLIFCLITICSAELRTWTAVNGNKVEANYISSSKGIVKLRLKSGKLFEVPKNKLSKEDNEFIDSLFKKEVAVGSGVRKNLSRADNGDKVEEPEAETKPKDESSIDSIRYEIKDGMVTITGCDKKASGTITIPATIDGKTVTNIGNKAFDGCRSLTSVTIPDSVTSIGYSAFSYCRSLTNVTIPDSVTSIGFSAFSRCTNLTRITIGNGVTNIGNWAFSDCEGLTNVTIGDSVTSIGESAFDHLSSLKSVTFLGDAPRSRYVFSNSYPTIYRKPEAKGWGDTFGGRPVKLISKMP